MSFSIFLTYSLIVIAVLVLLFGFVFWKIIKTEHSRAIVIGALIVGISIVIGATVLSLDF